LRQAWTVLGPPQRRLVPGNLSPPTPKNPLLQGDLFWLLDLWARNGLLL